jgi:hypothetical protein
MLIRCIALSAAVIVGALGFAGKADAQIIYSGGYYYSPGVVYSSYYSPSYYPYSSGVYPSSYYGAPYSTGYWSSYGYWPSSPPYRSGYRSYSPYSYYRGYRGGRWRW